MESFVVTWREILIVVVVVLAVYIAEMLLLMRVGTRRRRGRARADKAARTHDGGGAIEAELRQLREHIGKLEADIVQLKSGGHGASPYNHAIELAQQGIDASELAQACGISRGEAELIVALYRSHSS
ncbi:MAG: DUF2802 domain-containing protein [Betaproteobacteria bacterium]|nr:DUF2802 domain-containing protein [Betaproteobacteria bacterium]